MLSLEHVSSGYRNSVYLSDIHFSASPGEVIALVGPNGAGKTTLIRTISGVIPVLQGSIQAFSKPIHTLPTEERSKLMAVVPQEHQLPDGFTGWQTVILGRTPYLNWWGDLSERDKKITLKAMELTQTLHLQQRKLSEISGGELQRLLLARALAQQTPILLLDEPTTHLDLKFQFQLLEMVQKAAREQNLIVIMAMHDLNLVTRFSDKVVLLHEGRMLDFGAPSDVFTASQLQALYEIPIIVEKPDNSALPWILPGTMAE